MYSQFNKMNVIIIGNGATALNSRKQEFIDNSEVVIRMNNFRIEGFERFVGTKTSIYSCSQEYLQTIPFSPEARKAYAQSKTDHYLKQAGQVLNTDRAQLIAKQVEKHGIEEFKESLYQGFLPPAIKTEELQEIWYLFQKTPMGLNFPFESKLVTESSPDWKMYSTGHRTLLFALNQYPQANIFVTGFDHFMKSGWYWDDKFGVHDNIGCTQNFNDGHPYLVERDIMNELQRTQQITLI